MSCKDLRGFSSLPNLNQLGFSNNLTFSFQWDRGSSALFDAHFQGAEPSSSGNSLAFSFNGTECINVSGDKGVQCQVVTGSCFNKDRCGHAEAALSAGVGPFQVLGGGSSWVWEGMRGGTAENLGGAKSAACTSKAGE
eukprot:CAMPEP_0175131566 /NCGR_PEP_ID=MMETSP0087-20121206/6614_1 /TAXON_ID=136419 /ORGANISM="Unknown Unknown, Strain D1" /LENGTH=137 /DNA_ID=CAMNT_0016413871 /DNA_START=94 /DNA_END=507 /DNA_ORIENTATION=-